MNTPECSTHYVTSNRRHNSQRTEHKNIDSLVIRGRIWCSLSWQSTPRGTALAPSLKWRYSFIFMSRVWGIVSLTFFTLRYLLFDQWCRSDCRVFIPWRILIAKYARISAGSSGVQSLSCLPEAHCFCSAFRFVSFTIRSIKSSENIWCKKLSAFTSGRKIFDGPVSFSKLFTSAFRKFRLHASRLHLHLLIPHCFPLHWPH